MTGLHKCASVAPFVVIFAAAFGYGALGAQAQDSQKPALGFGNSSNAQIQKLLRQQQKGVTAEPQEWHYTYVVPVDCGSDPPTKRVYVLTGQTGTYVEDFCGTLFNGTLTHAGDEPVTVGEITVNGARYSGQDASGDYGYFFGSDDLTGSGGYAVLLGEPYVEGQEPSFWDGQIGSRTQP